MTLGVAPVDGNLLGCSVCGKGNRAQCYCGIRPKAAALNGTDPEHTRYNELLAAMQAWPAHIEQYSGAAYALAQVEDTGHKAALLRIAETASNFAAAIKRAKPL